MHMHRVNDVFFAPEMFSEHSAQVEHPGSAFQYAVAEAIDRGA